MATKSVNHESQPLIPRPFIRSPSRVYLTVALILASASVATTVAVYKEHEHVPSWSPIVPSGCLLGWILKGFWDSRTVHQLRSSTNSAVDLEAQHVSVNGDSSTVVIAATQVRAALDETAIQAQIAAAKEGFERSKIALQKELDEVKDSLQKANRELERLQPFEQQAATLQGAEAARKAAEERLVTFQRQQQAANAGVLAVAAKKESEQLKAFEQEASTLRQQVADLRAQLEQAKTTTTFTDEENSLLQELDGMFEEYLASFPAEGSDAAPAEAQPGETSLATELLKILGKADVVKAKLEAFIQSRVAFITALREAGGDSLQSADDATVIASIQRDPTPLQSPAVKVSLGQMVSKSPAGSRAGTPTSSPAKGTPRRRVVPLTPTHSAPAAAGSPSPLAAPLATPAPAAPKHKSPGRNLNPAFAAAAANGTTKEP